MTQPIVFHYNKLNDGGLYVEIVDDHTRRISLFFEQDLSESSWNFVEKEGRMECGIIPKEFLDLLREQLKEEK